eukprot:SAG31_NODE_8046_length_1534_cov_1.428571_2_plen_166_part_00
MTAKKEQSAAKKIEIEAEIAAKEAANAETNQKFQAIQDAVTKFKFDTFSHEIGYLKGVLELAGPSTLIQTQLELATEAAGTISRKYPDFGSPDVVSAIKPEREPDSPPFKVNLPELPNPKPKMSVEEAKSVMSSYMTEKAAIEIKMDGTPCSQVHITLRGPKPLN